MISSTNRNLKHLQVFHFVCKVFLCPNSDDKGLQMDSLLRKHAKHVDCDACGALAWFFSVLCIRAPFPFQAFLLVTRVTVPIQHVDKTQLEKSHTQMVRMITHT